VHDERIGVGHVYHLFRLPEDLEQSIHQLLQEPAFTQSLPRLVAQRAEALENLRRLGSGTEKVDPGPQLIGPTNALRDIKFLRRAVGFYSAGFSHNTPVFPYFTDAA
ncbi:MAG TPA: BrxE family protein, partial [Anaerolineaceae bacterium]|nr:BrxE family protein [Anaerolineaceae bacterium]